MPNKSKILFVATSDSHIKAFHLPYIEWLSKKGHVVDLAVENRGNVAFKHARKVFYLPFPRSPFKSIYYSTYKKLKKIINNGNYNLVHCHTPIPGFIARLAAREARRKLGTKVLYTAHGFHFFKGAPLKNWLTYYPAEYYASKYTDGIVTINKEDFGYINGKMWHNDSYYIKGIGIDTSRFQTVEKNEIERIKTELGYATDDFILLYIAGFIYRKNHKFIIEATPRLKEQIPNLKILFAGRGVLLERMKALAQRLNLNDTIDFLGFRNDAHNLTAIADIGISSSRHEGLGLGIAEAMLCSKPVVATVDKGHKELIDDGVNGYLYPQENQPKFVDFVIKLYKNPELRAAMGAKGYIKAQGFTIENSLKSMAEIYSHYFE